MTSHRSEPDSFLNALTAQSKGRVPITQIAPRKENDALARAISYLGAVEVAPGRYAFKWCDEHDHPAQGRDATWYVGAGSALVDLVENHGENEDCTEMPKWWTPERRYAVTAVDDHEGDITETFATKEQAEDVCDGIAPRPTAVTADLQTGEEITA